LAFGINREELKNWKQKVQRGEIAFLTHYWIDDRFPGCTTVTKVGCNDMSKLADWGRNYGLKPEWIDDRKKDYPHYDLFGQKQTEILKNEGLVNRLVMNKKE
jgi:hypothetical protein